jgi:hypothetical protein
MHQYDVAADNTPTHGVLSSGSWQTRAAPGATRESMIKISHQITLTPGSRFGTRSTTDLTFKVLLWPALIDPPVGLFWLVSTTFEDFVLYMEKAKPYAAFVELCKQRKDVVEAWFTQVNLDWENVALGMYDASPILTSLPSTSNPLGTDIVNPDALTPFQFQLDRFLWALHCDHILRSTTHGSAIDRQALQNFLEHGHLCYPEHPLPIRLSSDI